jgi:pimeloyl-ACP methyl ester carboxylesterase
MEKYKQLIAQARDLVDEEDPELYDVLWKVIFYSPKTPVKPYQRQQLDEAAKFSVKITDKYSKNEEISVNGFKWGKGRHTILLTHGWASKAADFSEIIAALRQLPEVTLIAFDAPGNGSSEGHLSNLLLFTEAVKAVIENQGQPDILIGHSIGAMANIAALQEAAESSASLLISLTPLIRIKESFIASMDAVRASAETKKTMLRKIESYFNKSDDEFNLDHTYHLDNRIKHWIAYDKEDMISPYEYVEGFLKNHPDILSKSYDNAGHDRILKDPQVIADILTRVHTGLFKHEK